MAKDYRRRRGPIPLPTPTPALTTTPTHPTTPAPVDDQGWLDAKSEMFLHLAFWPSILGIILILLLSPVFLAGVVEKFLNVVGAGSWTGVRFSWWWLAPWPVTPLWFGIFFLLFLFSLGDERKRLAQWASEKKKEWKENKKPSAPPAGHSTPTTPPPASSGRTHMFDKSMWTYLAAEFLLDFFGGKFRR